MTLQDYSLTAFAVLNGARIFAYVPQIVCVYRDRTGALSVSMSTWGTFCAANLATVFYALAGTGDRAVAGVFALNAVACMAIFTLILRNRVQHAYKSGRQADLKQLLSSAKSAAAAPLAKMRDRLEDRLVERHAGDQWSDTIERTINDRWHRYRCGRSL